MPSFARNRENARMRRCLQIPRKNRYIHRVLARAINSTRIVEILVCEGILNWREKKLAVMTNQKEIRWAKLDNDLANRTTQERGLDEEQNKLASIVLQLQMRTYTLRNNLSRSRIGV